eukprot:1160344-Pelagomonas_calceolata.AAC.9
MKGRECHSCLEGSLCGRKERRVIVAHAGQDVAAVSVNRCPEEKECIPLPLYEWKGCIEDGPVTLKSVAGTASRPEAHSIHRAW